MHKLTAIPFLTFLLCLLSTLPNFSLGAFQTFWFRRISPALLHKIAREKNLDRSMCTIITRMLFCSLLQWVYTLKMKKGNWKLWWYAYALCATQNSEINVYIKEFLVSLLKILLWCSHLPFLLKALEIHSCRLGDPLENWETIPEGGKWKLWKLQHFPLKQGRAQSDSNNSWKLNTHTSFLGAWFKHNCFHGFHSQVKNIYYNNKHDQAFSQK